MSRFITCLLVVTAALLGAAAPCLGGEAYLFRQLTVRDGLSDNRVRNIAMTPDGLLCIRTNTVVNVYNGASFSYHRFDPSHIVYNEYSGYYHTQFDGQGRMWIKNIDKLWFLDTRTGRYQYDVAGFFASMGVTTPVENIFIDDEKNYWITTQDKSLLLYTVADQRLTPVSMPESELFFGAPLKITQYGDRYWIIYQDGSLRCWDAAARTFVSTLRNFLGLHASEIERIDLCTTATGSLWIMYNQGIFYYDTQKGTRRDIPIPLAPTDQLACMDIDRDGNIWLGSSKSGMRIIGGQDFSVRHLPYISLVNGTRISHNTDISDIFIDANDIVWVATANEGLLYHHRSMNRFPLVNSTSHPVLRDENIKCIAEDSDGTILLGTINGLMRYIPATGEVRPTWPELRNQLCTGLYRDSDDRIWVGTFQNGIFCIDKGRVRHYKYDEPHPVYISYRNLKPYYNSVRTFYEDPAGSLWVSVYGGIGKLDRTSGRIELLRDRFPQVSHMMLIRTILPLGDSTLLVTADNGLFRYFPKKDSVAYNADDQQFVHRVTKHNCTLRDSRSLLWFGTHDGLGVWNPRDGRLENFGLEQGMPDNILGIAEDDNGCVWVSSPSSLSKFVVRENNGDCRFLVTHYDSNNGVQNGTFFEHSVLKASDGSIYFGGTHGVNIVPASDITDNTLHNKPYFTDFKLFKTSVAVGERQAGNTILTNTIGNTRRIELRHNQNFITFEFAGLNYINPGQTYYRYMLENFDQQWTEIHPSNGLGSVTYSFLNPGSYRFRVLTSNNNHLWNEEYAEIEILIRHPWWGTLTARIGYVLLGLLGFYLLLLYFDRRNRRKLHLRQQEAAAQQKEELNLFKMKFFTNISHELRTPLTLIVTPLETMLRQEEDPEKKTRLTAVRRNALQLLEMVNQLLDFRKLETNREELRPSEADLIEFTETVCSTFRETAAGKMIDLNCTSRQESLYTRFDKSKMRKVLNNLLSNAFKFTPAGGSISVITGRTTRPGQEAEMELVFIEVSDTGAGIAEAELENIFTRFYQAPNTQADQLTPGSGIGLHVAREYVELHKGRIEVASREHAGATFTVLLPLETVVQTPAAETGPNDTTALHPAQPDAAASRATLLVVEDNEEFRRFVVGELRPHYHVLEAADGKQGLEAAHLSPVDLIVTDVMMPIMDGMELCHTLKNDIETSHIPVILLTARASDEHRMDGYNVGADEYISKPFNMEILLMRIRYHIEQHRNRIAAFSQEIEVNPSKLTITPLDEQLIQKALRCVEENMDNPEFSVETLSAYVGMHRMNLYRKLQSIVGQTPSVFIRSIRLKWAAQLLQESQLTVTEIAYMVGFSTVKYFGKYFKDEFGTTPSQYAERHKDNGTTKTI